MSSFASPEWPEIITTVGWVLLCIICAPFILATLFMVFGFATGNDDIGSAAASWMYQIGRVILKCLYLSLKSLSTLGCCLLFSPVILIFGAIVALGIVAALYLYYKYIKGDIPKFPFPPFGSSDDPKALFIDGGNGDIEEDDCKSVYICIIKFINEVITAVSPLVNISISLIINGLVGMILGFVIATIFINIRDWFAERNAYERRPISENDLNSFQGTEKLYWETILLLPGAGTVIGVCIGVVYPYQFL